MVMRSDNKTGAPRSDNAAYLKAWRALHPGRSSQYSLRYQAKHPTETKERFRAYREANPEKVAEWDRRYQAKHREELRDAGRRKRLEVLRHYGGKCACCGESEFRFLTIDHIKGDGAEHRKKMFAGKKTGSGTATIWWLTANGYPEGFQVLCYNCNCAKGRFGVCPHQSFRLLYGEA